MAKVANVIKLKAYTGVVPYVGGEFADFKPNFLQKHKYTLR